MTFILHIFVLIVSLAAISPDNAVGVAAAAHPTPFHSLAECQAAAKETMNKALLNHDHTVVGLTVGCVPTDIAIHNATGQSTYPLPGNNQ